MTLRLPTRVIAILVITTMLSAMLSPSLALALLDDPIDPIGTSTTNPGTGVDTWWRQGWGRDLFPQFELNLPAVDEPEYVVGALYAVDKNLATVVNTGNPDDYYRMARGIGPNMGQTIDIAGLVAVDPSLVSAEGQWYLHYKFFSNFAYSTRQHNIAFGVDVTPPTAVTGLTLNSAIGVPIAPGQWVPTSRAHLTWDSGPYDSLAGDAYYQVFVDDVPAVPESPANPAQGRVYVLPFLPTPNSITIENLPAGSHKVSVAVVDRATNVGPTRDVYFNSDPDTPTISLSVASLTGTLANLLALADDKGGVEKVEFFCDGVPVGTKTAKPYGLAVDMTPFGSGTHTFTATVTDMLGRTATATAGTTIDMSGGFSAELATTVDGVVHAGAAPSPLQFVAARTISVDFSSDIELDAFGYSLSRSPDTSPTVPSPAIGPPTAFLSVTDDMGKRGNGGSIVLDLDAWRASQIATPIDTLTLNDPIEGTWFLTSRGMRSDQMPPLSKTVRTAKFIVDLTPPRVPTGLSLTGSGSAAVPVTRCDVQWNNPAVSGWTSYDQLSGDATYRIYVNGVPAGSVNPLLGGAQSYFSVENLQAGRNTIAVSVVDNAGNESLPATVDVYSDPDAPVVSITSPGGSIINPSQLFSANVTDQGGVADVKFYLDGILLKTLTAVPYSFTADLSGFSLGAHVLTVVGKDSYGRTVAAQRNVTLARPPALSSVSAGPSPFYPIKRDRYRDNWTVSYTVNQPAYMTLRIYNASGTLVRTIGASKGAGRSSLVWNGKDSSGRIATGRFTAVLTASNANGSSKSGTLVTYIRNYQIIRISRNRVRVVPR